MDGFSCQVVLHNNTTNIDLPLCKPGHVIIFYYHAITNDTATTKKVSEVEGAFETQNFILANWLAKQILMTMLIAKIFIDPVTILLAQFHNIIYFVPKLAITVICNMTTTLTIAVVNP